MAAFDVIDINSKVVGSIKLSDEVFAAPIRPHLLTEIVHWQRASRRSGTQSTLTKAEVHGTTKKPFPQKGRGCARQGSMKNPHQIGGGVAFGPKPRDFSYNMPKAKRRAALVVALSARVKEKSFKVINEISLAEPKTKLAAEMLKGLSGQKALVIDVGNGALKQSMRNLQSAKYLDVAGVNVYDILHYPMLMVSEKAAKEIEQRVLGFAE